MMPALRTAALFSALASALLGHAAAAQTCSGSVRIGFADSRSGVLQMLPAQSLGVSAAFFTSDASAGTPTAAEARRDPAVEADGTERLGGPGRLSAQGGELHVRTGCGLALLHLRLTRGRDTMTLDVYRPHAHAPSRLDAPVLFRPGRYVLDLGTAQRVSTGGTPYVFSARVVRRASSAPVSGDPGE